MHGSAEDVATSLSSSIGAERGQQLHTAGLALRSSGDLQQVGQL